MQNNYKKRGLNLLEILLVIIAIILVFLILFKISNSNQNINQISKSLIPSDFNEVFNTRNKIYVNTFNKEQNLICPSGYIKVPGNILYGTKEFCVMKYEAKVVDINNPKLGLKSPATEFNTISNNVTESVNANGRAIASVASGYPVANISQTTAIEYCDTVGANLITNAEWMTIARNIESQPANWTSGTGVLYRGHSDNKPSKALEASVDDSKGYEGTDNLSPSIERRTHTLSNGEIIWDLSGNVWEWTSDTIMGKDQPTGNNTGFAWRQYNTINNYGTLNYDLIKPSNKTLNNNQNIGQIYSDGSVTNNTNYAFLRGGNWLNPARAGIFTLALNNTPSFSNANIGFRCVIN